MMAENIRNSGCSQRDSAEHEGYAKASRSFNRIWKERDSAQPKLLEAILHKDNFNRAYKRVKANKGAPGIDGMTIEEALPYLKEHQRELTDRIYRGKYTPSPVRRVEIPKPDGGVRKLGIPTVIDRTLQQAITQQLVPIYEPLFADGSFGYRPNPDKPEKFILYVPFLCYSKEKGGLFIMLLTDKYADKIYGTITCYDRMIIQGYIPNWSHVEAMTTYMKLNGIRIFDYPSFSQPLTEHVRQNAEKIAQENGIEIEFIRKLHAFRKDDRIQEIISDTGRTEGLVHIFSAMERCNTYKPWHDKSTGNTFLKFDQSKCLHYYFYFIDKELGLCYLRVPTWPPFRLQFYMNGHNLLAHKLDKKQIAYRMQNNAFLEISDIETSQKLSDRINPEGLHRILDIFAKRYSPVPESLGLGYTWTVQQIECATDIMFRKPEYLETIYDEIIHTAIFTVKPDNIATFLGQRITYNCTKEIGTNYNQRILGTRIKHHMGDVSIKMYDKFGRVLRIESTCNDISTFRVNREVQHRDGTSDMRKAPLKKSIYSLYQLFTILKSANYRYLEFISSFDDHSSGRKKLDDVSRSQKEKERSYRGFNFFNSSDLSVLEAISRGEYMAFGMQGKNIRQQLPQFTPPAMTRIFKRLRVHGLIEKIPGSYKYLITALGKEIIAAGLTIKNLILVPALTS